MSTLLHIIGVSAGDATLIEHTDGSRAYHILVDGGLNKQVVAEYLLSHHIYRLDLVVASHLDYDHLGGLQAVFDNQRIQVGEFWTFDIAILRNFLESGVIPTRTKGDPRDIPYIMSFVTSSQLQERCKSRGIYCRQVAAGHVARFGGLVFEVLYPTQLYLDYLYDPRRLKRLLQERRVPLAWKVGTHAHTPDEVLVEGKRMPHRRLRFSKESEADIEWLGEAREEVTKWTASDEAAFEAMSGYWVQQEGWMQSQGEIAPQSSGPEGILEFCSDRTIFNDLSTVFRVSAVGREGFSSVLFPGDLENWTPLILSNASQLKSDFLKVPHHGSKGVGWNRKFACDFAQARHVEGLQQLNAGGYFPAWPCPDFFCQPHWQGGLGDILDLVRPIKALLFPFPRFRLPHTEITDELARRDITILANRADGVSELASERAQSRVFPLEP